MTKLVWDQTTARRYENGISRVALFPIGGSGVPWNGVVSVTETTPNPEIQDLFMDGVKRLVLTSAKFYQAKLTAITLPKELRPFLGEASVIQGFRLTNQPRARFNLCYRSETNDGYRLHLIYNVLATPAVRTYSSLTGTPAAPTFDVTLDAVPTTIPTVKPTAHISIDSHLAQAGFVSYVEDTLYGTPSTTGHFPAFSELGGTF